MATVYWNENGTQLTPIAPSDLVGVGDSVAYDALSVVSNSSVGGLLISNTISGAAGNPYVKLGYISAGSMVQTAKIWTDASMLKFDLSSVTRLVISNTDIMFNGTSLLASVNPIWSDTVQMVGGGGGDFGGGSGPVAKNVISPTNSANIFSIGGPISGCSDLMQISDNSTFGQSLTASNGLVTTGALTAGSVAMPMIIDASGNMNLGYGSLGIVGSTLKLTCAVSGGNIAIGTNYGFISMGNYGAKQQIISPAVMSVMLGNASQVTADNVTAMGSECIASGAKAVVIGFDITASGTSCVVIGGLGQAGADNGPTSHANESVVVGQDCNVDVNSTRGIAIGYEATLTNSPSAIVIGNIKVGDGLVLGVNAGAVSGAIAVGGGLNSYDNQCIAGGANSLAFGINARSQGENAATLGQNTNAYGEGSVAFGYGASAQGVGCVAIGKNSDAHELACIAIGFAAVANVAKQIMLATDAIQMNILNGVADFVANTVKAPAMVLANAATPTPVAGQMYFDGTNFQGYDGSTWLQLDNLI